MRKIEVLTRITHRDWLKTNNHYFGGDFIVTVAPVSVIMRPLLVLFRLANFDWELADLT